ncbi:glycosyltransferase family 4 protein [Natronomonas halophila]|uniref:glycosyltransferase family 4 protein n=1 Tax=Natronomonas halophila TaxID=2747817 RepID=UPI0015B49E7D|nr:glycosyltransferase family 4 protein [Natronomonas halophila]QLD86832.1 glycosyltransferase family 4 protein [Natronomonas halophila]
MTRTLIVSHFFSPESLGGAHRWKKLAEQLPDDHDCRVICPPPSFPYGEFDRTWKPLERDRLDGVPVTRLWTYQPKSDSTSEESNLGRILNYVLFSLFASLYVLCNFWRYDTIVTVSAPHTTFLPGIVGKTLGLAWMPDIFDLWLDNALDLGYVEKDTVPYRFIAELERRAIQNSNHVLVITQTMAAHFAEKYDVSMDRFTLVPFGVDEELFAPQPGSADTDTVVYTGNMGEAHALRPFILAFKHLEDVAELRLVGTGKRREELEALCREEGLTGRVRFEGVVPREEIPKILAEATSSFVPLKQGQNLDYARPTKLLESMAVGTPYIASSLREIERITEESGAGFAVDNDSEEVANAVRKLVDDDDLQREMGERGVEFINREHRWPELATRVDKAIKNADTFEVEPTD